jgi:hypothetical protein
MNMRMGTVLVAIATFAGGVLATGEASADYLCQLTYYAKSGTPQGTDGFVRITTYTGPSCTGTFVGTYYLCTANANSPVCTNIPLYQHDRSSLQTTFLALQHASAMDQRVTVSVTNNCYMGGSGCLAIVNFLSD